MGQPGSGKLLAWAAEKIRCQSPAWMAGSSSLKEPWRRCVNLLNWLRQHETKHLIRKKCFCTFGVLWEKLFTEPTWLKTLLAELPASFVLNPCDGAM